MVREQDQPHEARRRSVTELYRTHFSNAHQERQFLSSISFITHAIRHHTGPFRNVSAGGRHLHHLVLGILLLLGDGYLWLSQLGTGEGASSRAASLSTALAYGAGSALTLDEFALWLNLKDVYWSHQGRESLDAVALWAGCCRSASGAEPSFARSGTK
ncbi:MAG: hypothetical protein JO057_28210 [Chloroflexi bacterium]|nr:hypothetical protein [Chloroflexota bacterium]